jgi:methylated-DNA-protein-cysteine methyltransferase-like protein
MNSLSDRIIEAVRSVPYGRVATYGDIAFLAGHPKAARRVARLLHSSSASLQLPWHRVVGSQGKILLKGAGFDEQKRRLQAEGVIVDTQGRIDLELYRAKPADEGPLI